MRACITGSFALLLLCVGGVHAQQASRLQVGTPVRATLAADDTLRYELNLAEGPLRRRPSGSGRGGRNGDDHGPGRQACAAGGARRARRPGVVCVRDRHGGPVRDRGCAGDGGQRWRRACAAHAFRAGGDHTGRQGGPGRRTVVQGHSRSRCRSDQGRQAGVREGVWRRGSDVRDAVHAGDADEHRFLVEAVHRVRTRPAGIAGQALAGRRRAEAHSRAQGLRQEDHRASSADAHHRLPRVHQHADHRGTSGAGGRLHRSGRSHQGDQPAADAAE